MVEKVWGLRIGTKLKKLLEKIKITTRIISSFTDRVIRFGVSIQNNDDLF